MTITASLSVELCEVGKTARGRRVGSSLTWAAGAPIRAILTDQQLHLSFVDRDGPSFAVDMNALARAATDAIEEAITGKRRLIE
jgi:hypothetical protein